MRKLFIVAIGFFILALPLSANAISYNLFTFQGDPASVTITITDETTTYDRFRFDLLVNPYGPNNVIGDLRGFWFNIDPYPDFGPNPSFDKDTDTIPGGFIFDAHDDTAYPYWVTNYEVSENSVQNFGPSIYDAGPFDAGVQFGTPGIVENDIQATTFWVRSLGEIELADLISEGDPTFNSLFGAQLRNVTLPNGERDGNSRLTVVPEPIPEPATMLLLGSGLLGFAAARRKKFLRNKFDS